MYTFNHPKQKELRQHLRNNMPPAEQILWSHLKGKQLLGYKFRRQYGIGGYVTDFYCHEAKLVIELDGDSHYEEGAQKYDRNREEYIRSLGIGIIRFTNLQIYETIDGVIEAITKYLTDGTTPNPSLQEGDTRVPPL